MTSDGFELPLAQDVPQIFEQSDGTRWLRTGYCNRCGECCRTGDPVGDGSNIVRGEVACSLYVEEGGVGCCTDRQHPYYLNGCNVWPSVPGHIADKPSCTYSFVEVTDGG